jgi:hypothetical protein
MTDDPRSLALEHVAWCVREHLHLAELHEALGREAGPRFRHWEDAIARLTRIASNMILREQQRAEKAIKEATDALDAAINDKRREFNRMRIELGALEHAASLRPEPFRRRQPPGSHWPARRSA